MVNEETTDFVMRLAAKLEQLNEAALIDILRGYLNRQVKIPEIPETHGKMSLKKLMQKDQGAKMAEIRPEAVRGFERIAKKYNVDFAITRDKSQTPPMYQLFFKGRDEDVISKAFNEYVNKQQKKARRVPFEKRIEKLQEKADHINKSLGLKENIKIPVRVR